MKTRNRFLALAGTAVLVSGCVLEPFVNDRRVDVPFKDVKVMDDHFEPDSIRVSPTQAIRFLWEGDPQIQHNVTWDQTDRNPAIVDSPTQVAPGEHYVPFDDIGTYTYRCTIHPEMTGQIRVVPPVVAELPL